MIVDSNGGNPASVARDRAREFDLRLPPFEALWSEGYVPPCIRVGG